MALLEMHEWYDLTRDTNWTPGYVAEEEIFPPELSDPFGISVEQWETFDEPYKVCYRDYVETQRDKDIGAYSVKSALARADSSRRPHRTGRRCSRCTSAPSASPSSIRRPPSPA